MSSRAALENEGVCRPARRGVLLALGASVIAAVARVGPGAAADAPTVVKIGRFRYGDDLVNIRFAVHAADMSDDGSTIEPAVTGTVRGTVKRVQGKLERKSFGDSLRVLRVQEADDSWHDVNIWVPVRLEAP
jgi:hypothetical protein